MAPPPPVPPIARVPPPRKSRPYMVTSRQRTLRTCKQLQYFKFKRKCIMRVQGTIKGQIRGPRYKRRAQSCSLRQRGIPAGASCQFTTSGWALIANAMRSSIRAAGGKKQGICKPGSHEREWNEIASGSSAGGVHDSGDAQTIGKRGLIAG